MKYEKFEGDLGEFLEAFINGEKFYTAEYIDIASWEDDIRTLHNYYNLGVYTQREEVWTDHLPVLCWVTDFESFEYKWLTVVTEYDNGRYWVESAGCDYKYARPVPQSEIDELTWKD